jgi:hypothetical protein
LTTGTYAYRLLAAHPRRIEPWILVKLHRINSGGAIGFEDNGPSLEELQLADAAEDADQDLLGNPELGVIMEVLNRAEEDRDPQLASFAEAMAQGTYEDHIAHAELNPVFDTVADH